jgi:hypothetical protein
MFFQIERILSAERPFMDTLTKSAALKIPYAEESRSTIGSRRKLSGPWKESDEARESYKK